MSRIDWTGTFFQSLDSTDTAVRCLIGIGHELQHIGDVLDALEDGIEEVRAAIVGLDAKENA